MLLRCGLILKTTINNFAELSLIIISLIDNNSIFTEPVIRHVKFTLFSFHKITCVNDKKFNCANLTDFKI